MKELADLGFPPKKNDIEDLVKGLLKGRLSQQEEPPSIGRNFVYKMRRRHEDLDTTWFRHISHSKIFDSRPERISQYMDNFKYWIDKRAIQPRNIWNMDETGWARGFNEHKQRVYKGHKNA